MPPATTTVDGGTFDSTPLPVTSTTGWTRIITLAPLPVNRVVGIDVAVTSNPAKLRLTRTSKRGENHGLLQTDLTMVGRYVLLATNGGSGTVNQPNAGDIVSLNINSEGSAEIGIEAQATTAGASTVRAYTDPANA